MAESASEIPAPSRSAGRDLTVGSIPRHLIAFSLPMLAGTVLQAAYSFINAIWVGRFIGTEALAAVTISFPIVFVLIAVGAGMTMAANIQVAQYHGARDRDSVRRVVNNSTILIGTLSVLLVVIGEFSAPAILRAMDTPPDVYPLACSYLRIFLLSLPMGFGMFLTRSLLQGIGNSTTPLYFQAGAVILTIALDPILMFGWFGIPRLGLNGTAWATLITHSLGLAALVGTLRASHNPVAPRLGWRLLDRATLRTTIRIGVPSAIQQSLVSVGMVFVIGIVNSFGEDAAAAFGAASRVDQLAFMPAMTIGMAASTLAGQNIGAGRHHRVREVLVWGCLLSGVLTLICSAVAVSMPAALIRIFTRDARVVAMGATYLRIAGSGYICFAVMFVSNGIINGAGHTMVTTVTTLITLWVVRVPVAWGLSRHLGKVDGVWWAMVISFAVAMLTSLAYYATGRWRRPVLRHRVMPIAPPSPEAAFASETAEA